MRSDLRTILATAIVISIGAACAATAKEAAKKEPAQAAITLPAPELDRSAPLMQALKDRKSTRSYSERKISLEQLANLLWAANGVNREDGKHTSPSPRNAQGVDIYVVLEEGAYVYDPAKHVLVPVASGDYRKVAGTQEYVWSAPLNLVFVADTEVIKYDRATAAIPVGCMVQNVGLYCASDGLGSVVRGSFKAEELSKALKLKPTQTIHITQTVGFPK
jgi:SagB-type dehydrogenase family enzyme